jgi:protein-tyrosine kinase
VVAHEEACVEVTTTVEQSNVVLVETGSAVLARGERSIGTILIQAGRLTLENAERVLQLQHEQGLRFGDAATQLGLLTPADIEFALARQFDYPYLLRGESSVSEQVITAYAPFSPQGRMLGNLRGQVMLRWFDSAPDRNALAIVSAERGEGRSFIASNLAVACAQLGQKTLLIDADMRNPVQHVLFNLDNRTGLSAVLAGRGGPDAVIQPIAGLRGLSVFPAGAAPPNPLELLARPMFAQLLSELALEFRVILLDSAPAAEYGDAQTIAMRAGAALIVARKNATRMWRMRGVSETVTNASATVIGTVLNDF